MNDVFLLILQVCTSENMSVIVNQDGIIHDIGKYDEIEIKY